MPIDDHLSDQPRPPVQGGPGLLAGVDVSKPHVAHVINYMLGGGYNFPSDRRAAARLTAAVPDLRTALRHHRQFVHRVVQEVAELGVSQFLDLGAGLPLVRATHEVAQESAPQACTVYVDNACVITARLELLTAGDSRTHVVEEDLSDVSRVLDRISANALLDLTQPVAVLMCASLHHLADDPAPIVDAYIKAISPGSYVAISHLTADHEAEAAAAIQAEHLASEIPIWPRTSQWLADRLANLELLDPGVTAPELWRPESAMEPEPGDPALFSAAVARKPDPRSRSSVAQ